MPKHIHTFEDKHTQSSFKPKNRAPMSAYTKSILELGKSPHKTTQAHKPEPIFTPNNEHNKTKLSKFKPKNREPMSEYTKSILELGKSSHKITQAHKPEPISTPNNENNKPKLSKFKPKNREPMSEYVKYILELGKSRQPIQEPERIPLPVPVPVPVPVPEPVPIQRQTPPNTQTEQRQQNIVGPQIIIEPKTGKKLVGAESGKNVFLIPFENNNNNFEKQRRHPPAPTSRQGAFNNPAYFPGYQLSGFSNSNTSNTEAELPRPPMPFYTQKNFVDRRLQPQYPNRLSSTRKDTTYFEQLRRYPPTPTSQEAFNNSKNFPESSQLDLSNSSENENSYFVKPRPTPRPIPRPPLRKKPSRTTYDSSNPSNSNTGEEQPRPRKHFRYSPSKSFRNYNKNLINAQRNAELPGTNLSTEIGLPLVLPVGQRDPIEGERGVGGRPQSLEARNLVHVPVANYNHPLATEVKMTTVSSGATPPVSTSLEQPIRQSRATESQSKVSSPVRETSFMTEGNRPLEMEGTYVALDLPPSQLQARGQTLPGTSNTVYATIVPTKPTSLPIASTLPLGKKTSSSRNNRKRLKKISQYPKNSILSRFLSQLKKKNKPSTPISYTNPMLFATNQEESSSNLKSTPPFDNREGYHNLGYNLGNTSVPRFPTSEATEPNIFSQQPTFNFERGKSSISKSPSFFNPAFGSINSSIGSNQTRDVNSGPATNYPAMSTFIEPAIKAKGPGVFNRLGQGITTAVNRFRNTFTRKKSANPNNRNRLMTAANSGNVNLERQPRSVNPFSTEGSLFESSSPLINPTNFITQGEIEGSPIASLVPKGLRTVVKNPNGRGTKIRQQVSLKLSPNEEAATLLGSNLESESELGLRNPLLQTNKPNKTRPPKQKVSSVKYKPLVSLETNKGASASSEQEAAPKKVKKLSKNKKVKQVEQQEGNNKTNRQNFIVEVKKFLEGKGWKYNENTKEFGHARNNESTNNTRGLGDKLIDFMLSLSKEGGQTQDISNLKKELQKQLLVEAEAAEEEKRDQATYEEAARQQAEREKQAEAEKSQLEEMHRGLEAIQRAKKEAAYQELQKLERQATRQRSLEFNAQDARRREAEAKKEQNMRNQEQKNRNSEIQSKRNNEIRDITKSLQEKEAREAQARERRAREAPNNLTVNTPPKLKQISEEAIALITQLSTEKLKQILEPFDYTTYDANIAPNFGNLRGTISEIIAKREEEKTQKKKYNYTKTNSNNKTQEENVLKLQNYMRDLYKNPIEEEQSIPAPLAIEAPPVKDRSMLRRFGNFFRTKKANAPVGVQSKNAVVGQGVAPAAAVVPPQKALANQRQTLFKNPLFNNVLPDNTNYLPASPVDPNNNGPIFNLLEQKQAAAKEQAAKEKAKAKAPVPVPASAGLSTAGPVPEPINQAVKRRGNKSNYTNRLELLNFLNKPKQVLTQNSQISQISQKVNNTNNTIINQFVTGLSPISTQPVSKEITKPNQLEELRKKRNNAFKVITLKLLSQTHKKPLNKNVIEVIQTMYDHNLAKLSRLQTKKEITPAETDDIAHIRKVLPEYEHKLDIIKKYEAKLVGSGPTVPRVVNVNKSPIETIFNGNREARERVLKETIRQLRAQYNSRKNPHLNKQKLEKLLNQKIAEATAEVEIINTQQAQVQAEKEAAYQTRLLGQAHAEAQNMRRNQGNIQARMSRPRKGQAEEEQAVNAELAALLGAPSPKPRNRAAIRTF